MYLEGKPSSTSVSSALQLGYFAGLNFVAAVDGSMETEEAIRSRRSVHEYTSEEVDDDTLKSIFELVRWSPSSYNLQPWEFLVVRDEEGKETLKDCAYGQEHVTDAGAVVVVFGDRDRGAHAEEVFRNEAEKGYRDPDTVDDMIQKFQDEGWQGNDEWAMQSSMIAATTLMYAAWSEGVASCPMGGWDGDAIREEFDVPESWKPVLMVTLGYVDRDGDEWNRERKYRRSTDEFVHLDGL